MGGTFWGASRPAVFKKGSAMSYIIPIATAIVVVVVVIVGGVVSIVHPAALGFDQYVRDVSIAAGLLAIGRGLDSKSTV